MKYEIGARIKKYRESAGLSQKELAAQIGVGNSRVSNWELGINRPDVDLLMAICEALAVSPQDLLGISQKKDSPAQPSAGDAEKIYERLQSDLTHIGLIAPGGDISDADMRVLVAAMEIINTILGRSQQ